MMSIRQAEATSVLVLTALLLAPLVPGTIGAAEHGLDPASSAAIDRAMAGEHRSTENKARDKFRRPKETLSFFGFRTDMTVVEIWPGGGWYTLRGSFQR